MLGSWAKMPRLDPSLLLPSRVALATSFDALALVLLFWGMKETMVPCHLFSFCLVPVGRSGLYVFAWEKKSRGVSDL